VEHFDNSIRASRFMQRFEIAATDTYPDMSVAEALIELRFTACEIDADVSR
jgi:hypothetical protein